MPRFQKPFLKWVGGKTQLIDTIAKLVPTEMENYHEPFVGGGSVLLAVLSMARDGAIEIKGSVYASDANQALINTYKDIQTSKDELYVVIAELMGTYDGLDGEDVSRNPQTYEEALTSKESFYYWIRSQFNAEPLGTLRKSALFMVLNKTCFRGMYREGPNGFNVPYGHYKKTPVVVTRDHLDAICDLIKDVIFTHQDFANSLDMAATGDFVYLDPPYAPENAKSFVGYTNAGFSKEMHYTLFQQVAALDGKKVGFVMSNANVDMVTQFFQLYECVEVSARRAIHSKKPGTTTKELLIYSPNH